MRRVTLKPLAQTRRICVALSAPARRGALIGWLVMGPTMLVPAAHALETWQRCPGNGWQVTGADAVDQALICNGVASASDFLASCGILGTTPPRIRVLDSLPHSCGVDAWGVYDASSNEITLGNPAICVTSAPERSLFRLIAPSLAYISVAAHEATHAILFSRGLGEDRHLEHEYIASVVSMQVLPDIAREAVLEPLDLGARVELWEINPVLLALDPALFAGRAWRHFEAEPDNCTFLRALADGLLRLPDFSAF
jgi:hypothetical protein